MALSGYALTSTLLEQTVVGWDERAEVIVATPGLEPMIPCFNGKRLTACVLLVLVASIRLHQI